MNALSPSSGSLATRPVRQIPNSRRRGTAASDVPARLMGGRSQPLSTPSAPMAVAPNRRDNILNARSDGTFQSKRDAYNQQGLATGHSMDEAGNITGPTAATPPKGKLIPGSSPGSAIWQPAAPRHITGATIPTGIPAVDALSPQVSTPPSKPAPGAPFTSMAPGSRNLYAEEQQRQQTVTPPVTNNVTRNVTPPVTNNVTRNVTPPVTPPSQGHAANKLAAFNAKNPNVLTGAAGVAQTDALAAERRALVTNTQAKLKTLQQPNTTTPAGVPAPAATFSAQQADAYNTAMASVSGVNAPAAVNPSRPASTPAAPQLATAAPAPAPPVPGKIQVRNAVVGAAQGLQTAVTMPGKAALAPLAAPLAAAQNPAVVKAVAQGTAQTATLPARMAVAPLRAAKAAGHAAGQAVKSAATRLANWWETGESTITPKTLATRPTAQRPQLALVR